MNVTIFGTGYVGLVTGTCLAEVGNRVLCLDIDQQRIDRLRAGDLPIVEPGLEEMLRRNQATGQLAFTIDHQAAVDHGDVLVIAVGTPPRADGSADLAAVSAVARDIGARMTDEKLVVVKSTVPVGTSDAVRGLIAQELAGRRLDLPFDVVANPEFLREGVAVDDFMRPDRVIVGADAPRAIALLRELYAPFNRNHDRLLVMDARSAEFAKYAANTMLAARVSLMNEFANLSERLGVDVEQVRLGVGSDPRIGYAYLYPGCGYGGSCFPKDVRALERMAAAVGYDAEMVRAIEQVNQRQQRRLVDKVCRHYGGDLGGRVFALWGLSFKPETDDLREAPSRTIMETLWAAGAAIQAFDPAALDEAAHLYGHRADFHRCETKEAALQHADALIIATEWREFRGPNLGDLKAALREPVVFDGRNLYDPRRMADEGFAYYGIGRGERLP